MLVYGLVNFGIGILFIIFGICIFKGNIGLIHDYHQTKVEDKINYGKAMGKAIGGIGVVALISAFISFIPNILEFIPVVFFICGFIVCFVFIFKIQKKYNGGMF